jgi:GGDEF domain-containing protein
MGEAEATERAEVIRRAVEGLDISPVIGGDSLPVTASVGVVLYPRDATDPMELVESAFTTMWEAREAGGNRVFASKAVPN